MKLLTFLFALLLTLNSFALDCISPEKSLSCDYYRGCVEKKFKCGETGYPLGYGEKYCLKFLALTKNELSQKGLKWRDSTLRCLQTVLSLSINNGEIRSCQEVLNEGFDSHPGCYTLPSNNLCDLPMSDWKTIVSVPSVDDIVSKKSAVQIVTVLGTCANSLVSEYQQIQRTKENLYLKLKSLDGTESLREIEILEKLNYIDELQNQL